LSTEIIGVDFADRGEESKWEFYVKNDQDKYLIRIRDEKQLELVDWCIHLDQYRTDEFEELKSEYKYFDSVEEYIAFKKEEFAKLDEL
jgi:hypothetical protein